MVPVGYWAGAGAGAGALTSILITGIWIRSRFNNKYAPQYRLKLQFFYTIYNFTPVPGTYEKRYRLYRYGSLYNLKQGPAFGIRTQSPV